MKVTDKPTQHILVKAETNSDWDSCDFAIITISDKWKEQQSKRLKSLEYIKDDDYFLDASYMEESVDFYRLKQTKLSEDPIPNLDKLLGENLWSFVELDKEEQEEFATPKSYFNCYKIKIDKYGDFHYIANGKHTEDEYWTIQIKLTDIIK